MKHVTQLAVCFRGFMYFLNLFELINLLIEQFHFYKHTLIYLSPVTVPRKIYNEITFLCSEVVMFVSFRKRTYVNFEANSMTISVYKNVSVSPLSKYTSIFSD